MARPRRVLTRATGAGTTATSQMRSRKSISSEVDLSLDQEERTFIRPNNISPHLFCVICSEVFKRPYRAPCGHSYCYECISQWLKKVKACPIDRKPLTLVRMHHDFILENIIGDYTVACPWRSSGCSYIGPLCQLDSHKKACVMNPDHLPETLRIREKENMKLQRPTNGAPSSMNPTKPIIKTTASDLQTTLGVGSEVEADEWEDEDLPPAPPPSLLMRLFQKSDTDSRDVLCSLLGEPTIGVKRPQSTSAGSKRSRKAF